MTEAEKLRNYRDLRVWKQGIDLAKKVYTYTAGFPVTERYGLTSQMRRAAVSIPSNIAEGYARTGTGEYLRFLSIAFGSVAELETQVILSSEFDYLDPKQSEDLLAHLDLIGKMLQGLQRSLEPYRVQDNADEEPLPPIVLRDAPPDFSIGTDEPGCAPPHSPNRADPRNPNSEVRNADKPLKRRSNHMYGKMKDYLAEELKKLEEQKLYKHERIIESPQGAEIVVRGQEVPELLRQQLPGPVLPPRADQGRPRGDRPARLRPVLGPLHLRHAGHPQGPGAQDLRVPGHGGHHPLLLLLRRQRRRLRAAAGRDRTPSSATRSTTPPSSTASGCARPSAGPTSTPTCATWRSWTRPPARRPRASSAA